MSARKISMPNIKIILHFNLKEEIRRSIMKNCFAKYSSLNAEIQFAELMLII